MKLMLEAVIKQPDGIIDVSVIIKEDNGKKRSYIYHLKDYKALEAFNNLYYSNKKNHGRALQILVRNNVQMVEDTAIPVA